MSIKFIEEKLKIVKIRLENSAEYKEIKILEELLKELRNQEPRSNVKKKIFTKDMNNSPMKNVPFGERTARIYEDMVKLATQHGEELYLKDVAKFLNLNFKPRDKKDRVHYRIRSYVTNYNKANSHLQKLKIIRTAQGSKLVLI